VDYPHKNRPYSLNVDVATGNDVNDGGLGFSHKQMKRAKKE